MHKTMVSNRVFYSLNTLRGSPQSSTLTWGKSPDLPLYQSRKLSLKHLIAGHQLNGQSTKAGGKGLQGGQENRENHRGGIPSISERNRRGGHDSAMDYSRILQSLP